MKGGWNPGISFNGKVQVNKVGKPNFKSLHYFMKGANESERCQANLTALIEYLLLIHETSYFKDYQDHI